MQMRVCRGGLRPTEKKPEDGGEGRKRSTHRSRAKVGRRGCGQQEKAREAPRFGDGTREPCRRRRVPGVLGLASSGDPSGVSWPAPASTGWKDSRGIRAPRRTPCSGPAPRHRKAPRASSDGRGSCRSHSSPLMSSAPPSHDASARQSADPGTRTPQAHAARASSAFCRIVPHRVQSAQCIATMPPPGERRLYATRKQNQVLGTRYVRGARPLIEAQPGRGWRTRRCAAALRRRRSPFRGGRRCRRRARGG